MIEAMKTVIDIAVVLLLLADGQTARLRKLWRTAALPLPTNDAVVLSFGWNTVGFGKVLGFEITEIMLICHGADHNDTICMAERRSRNP